MFDYFRNVKLVNKVDDSLPVGILMLRISTGLKILKLKIKSNSLESPGLTNH